MVNKKKFNIIINVVNNLKNSHNYTLMVAKKIFDKIPL